LRLKPFQNIIENAIINEITKTNSREVTKIYSAIFSYLIFSLPLLVLIDRKENRLLPANNIQAAPVNSSIIDASLNFDILSVVSTIRQKPSKLDDVLRMCCELPFAITFQFSCVFLKFAV
jgi:hypothetical protein